MNNKLNVNLLKKEEILKKKEIILVNEISQNLTLTWKNINYTIKRKKDPLKILENVNGFVKSGDCLAIIGPSGCGKTTLLTVLAGRLKSSNKKILDGEVNLNKNKMNWKNYKNIIGYVAQQDIFLESLSIEDIFNYTIELKNPKMKKSERLEKLNSMIRNLKLETSRKTIIGGRFYKGISGGEKRRLNIGCELLKNPRILFLDEPTSGLDSYTGYLIIKLLKNLAKEHNLLIIYSIHQPSEDIAENFDKVMVLNKGKVSYFGHYNDINKYYLLLNQKFPEDMLILDHVLEVCVNGGKKVDDLFFDKLKKEHHKKIIKKIESVEKKQINTKVQKPSFCKEFNILFKRAFLNFYRNPYIKIKVFHAFFIAAIVLLLYWQLAEVNILKQTTIANRLGCLFFVSYHFFFFYFQASCAIFPLERKVFVKEYNSGLYGVSSYYFSKMAIECFLTSFFPVIFSSIIYYGVNFNNSLTHFLYFNIGAVLLSLNATMIGIFFAGLCKDFVTVMQLAPLIILPFALFTGFTTNSKNMLAGLRYIGYTSPIKYIFEFLVINEFEDLTYLEEFNPIKILGFDMEKNLILIILSFSIILWIICDLIVLRFNSQPLKI